MKNKLSQKDHIMPLFKSGMSLMVGGFLGRGTPDTLIDWLIESGTNDLFLIVTDTNFPGKGIGKLITEKRVSRLIASHIGTNPDTGTQVINGTLNIELSPQGTLAERIRAGGAGLGGILTDIGMGTEIESGKTIIEVDGRPYLLEKPLKADLALIGGTIADGFGNIIYMGTTRNFNHIMATAAETVIAEAEEIVEIGAISPERVMTPGIYVDYIIRKGGEGL